jgi:hypothetical protein
MTTRRSATHRLRSLWVGLPSALIPKPEIPSKLGDGDLRENYLLRLDGQDDPVELVRRVRSGIKPMAVVLIRWHTELRVTERSLIDSCKTFGLGCKVFFARDGKRVGVVFQERVTLGHFYDPQEIIARYKTVEVDIHPEIFNTPLEVFARPLVSDDFPPDVALAMHSLCQGHSVQETLEYIIVQRKQPKTAK